MSYIMCITKLDCTYWDPDESRVLSSVGSPTSCCSPSSLIVTAAFLAALSHVGHNHSKLSPCRSDPWCRGTARFKRSQYRTNDAPNGDSCHTRKHAGAVSPACSILCTHRLARKFPS